MGYQPFNAVFWAIVAIAIAAIVILTAAFRKKEEASRRKLVFVICIFNVLLFIAYKINLRFDPEYISIVYPDGNFTFWNELPLNLCTIVMFILPWAIADKYNYLLSFCCAAGFLGSIPTFISPCAEMTVCPITTMRALGYFGEHAILFVVSVLLITLKLFKARYRDIPKRALLGLAMTLGAHIVNLILRKTGLAPMANYFLTVSDYNSSLANTMQGILGSPLVAVLVFGTLIYVAVDLIVVTIVRRTNPIGKERYI